MAAPALNSLIVRVCDAFDKALDKLGNDLECLGGSTLGDMANSSSALAIPAALTLAIERYRLNGKFLSYITSLCGEMGDSVVVGIDPLDGVLFSMLPARFQERILQAQLGGFSSESFVKAVASVGSLNMSEMEVLARYCDCGALSGRRASESFTSWGGNLVFPGEPADIPPSLTLIGYQYCPGGDPPQGLLCQGEDGELYFSEIRGGFRCCNVADRGPFHAGSQAILDLGVTMKRPEDAFYRNVGKLFRSWAAARETYNDNLNPDGKLGWRTGSRGKINVFRDDGFAVLLRSINSLERAFLARARSFGGLEWPSPAAIRNVSLGREQSIFAKQEGLLNLEHSPEKLVHDASALFSGVGSVFSGEELCSTSTSTAIEAARDIQKHLWDAFPEPKKKLEDDAFNPVLAFLADRMDLNLPERAGWLASRASQYSQVSFKGGSGLLIPTSGKWLLFPDDTAGFPTPRLLPFKCAKVSRQVSLLPKVAEALGIPLDNDAMRCILGVVKSDGRKVLTLLTDAFPEALRFIAPATRTKPVPFSKIVARCRRSGGDGDLVACMAATAIGASSPAYVGGGRFRCYFDTVYNLGNWPYTGYHLIADCPVPCPELMVGKSPSAGSSLYVGLAPGYSYGDRRHLEVERGTIEPEDWMTCNGLTSSIQVGRSGSSPPGVAHMRLHRLTRAAVFETTVVSLRLGLKSSTTSR